MDVFNIELFTARPTLLALDSFKKTDLLTIAQHYKLSVTTTQKKGEIKRLIWDYLTDEELVPEEETESLGSSNTLLELKRLEFQEREKERENQVRIKEMEIGE